MKRCESCSSINPGTARFCMQCGHALPEDELPTEPRLNTGGIGLFALTLLGSIVISLVLVFVFGLPVFFLAGFLPLFWLNRKR